MGGVDLAVFGFGGVVLGRAPAERVGGGGVSQIVGGALFGGEEGGDIALTFSTEQADGLAVGGEFEAVGALAEFVEEILIIFFDAAEGGGFLRRKCAVAFTQRGVVGDLVGEIGVAEQGGKLGLERTLESLAVLVQRALLGRGARGIERVFPPFGFVAGSGGLKGFKTGLVAAPDGGADEGFDKIRLDAGGAE